MKCSLGIPEFLEEISSLSHSIVFLFLCIDDWGRLSYLSLLFFGLHSNGHILPFLLCFLLLFYYFLYFFALITEESFLISPCYSLQLFIQMDISFLFSFAFHFFSQLLVRPPLTAILLFCISFSWGWSWSLSPVQCHKPPSIVLQVLYLSHLIPWLCFSLPQ